MDNRKRLSCRDVGVECDFEAEAMTVEEVIERCAEHASTEHGLKSFSPELYAKMRRHVRSVPVDVTNATP